MKLVPAKTPELVKSIFPSFVWNIKTEEKILFLTFDDGPTPGVTDWVLELLENYNAKATFFCIGKNIESHPELFERIISQGHSIGNHTYNHLKGWKTKTNDYLKDVELTEHVIKDKLQNATSKNNNDTSWNLEIEDCDLNLFRPPYGKLKSNQSKALQALGYKIILWDVLSFDWDVTISEKDCLDNVLSSAQKGSIIVFHDSLKAQRNLKFALPRVLEHFSKKGFDFKSINEISPSQK